MNDPRDAFLKAATWHGSLAEADALLAAQPGLCSSDIHLAAILGDDAAVSRFIAEDPAGATLKAGPYDVEPLVYLCLSKYLRLDPSRSDAFMRAATALLDAGASPNAGFWNEGEWETALYGAAGVAHHEAMTRLLLARGADPNDEDTVYHAPEEYDLGALRALVETGKLTPASLAVMLVRKVDWHDEAGIRYLLDQGADPNGAGGRFQGLHHALARDASLRVIELMLDRGADFMAADEGGTTAALAARRGRGDVLAAVERRGMPVEFRGVERLIAACAREDGASARALAHSEPGLVRDLLAAGSSLLAEFSINWNTEGIRLLLDLGVPVGSRYEGDGYYDLAKDSTALHAAAWVLGTDVVKLLIERGAPVNAKDAKGQTAVQLAVKACVDSYWTDARTPEPARALLAAGASVAGVKYPSGYQDVDDLLKSHGA